MRQIKFLTTVIPLAFITFVSPALPAEYFRDCASCPEMVFVPAGSFIMGSSIHRSENPPTPVVIPMAFAIGKYEVTFDEWKACVMDGGCGDNRNPSDSGWGKGKRPVIFVNWNHAQQFISWLNSKVVGNPYRLPTEAEWEYTARGDRTGNNQSEFGWGNTIDCSNARYNGGEYSDCYHQPSDKYRGTRVVGSYSAGKFGLYDLHGNVWEWVEDCWHRNYDSMPENTKQFGSAWTSENCIFRVIRGGSWINVAGRLRSANRSRLGAVNRDFNFGFRVARSLP
jgi:formylglycine-generating enzyme required for sulfatase activity